MHQLQLVSLSLSYSIVCCFLLLFFFQFSREVSVLILLFAFFQFYPVINRNDKVHYSASSLFLLIISWSGRDPFLSQNLSIIISIAFGTSYSYKQTLAVFHWNLGYSKFPRVSRTLLNILVDFNNVVAWMVSIFPLISNSSSLLSKP